MKSRIYLILTSLLLIAVGVVCILNPVEGFTAMAWLVGLIIFVAGGLTLLCGLRLKSFLPNSSMTTFLGVFELVIGLLFLSNSLLAATTLIVVFSLWIMFEGISLSVLSFDYKKSGYDRWWVMLLLGIVSILLGFLAMRQPSGAGSLLGFLLGIGILSNGVVRFVAVIALQRIHNRLRDLRESAEAVPIDTPPESSSDE